jgi:hypothetical protein
MIYEKQTKYRFLKLSMMQKMKIQKKEIFVIEEKECRIRKSIIINNYKLLAKTRSINKPK